MTSTAAPRLLIVTNAQRRSSPGHRRPPQQRRSLVPFIDLAPALPGITARAQASCRKATALRDDIHPRPGLDTAEIGEQLRRRSPTPSIRHFVPLHYADGLWSERSKTPWGIRHALLQHGNGRFWGPAAHRRSWAACLSSDHLEESTNSGRGDGQAALVGEPRCEANAKDGLAGGGSSGRRRPGLNLHDKISQGYSSIEGINNSAFFLSPTLLCIFWNRTRETRRISLLGECVAA